MQEVYSSLNKHTVIDSRRKYIPLLPALFSFGRSLGGRPVRAATHSFAYPTISYDNPAIIGTTLA